MASFNRLVLKQCGGNLVEGRPMLAEGEVAAEILERYQRLSQPFGTTVQIEGGVGYVRL